MTDDTCGRTRIADIRRMLAAVPPAERQALATDDPAYQYQAVRARLQTLPPAPADPAPVDSTSVDSMSAPTQP